MLGLKHSPTPVIVLGLTKGIAAWAIILSPITWFSTCSTIRVLVPVLTWSDLVFVIVLWKNPRGPLVTSLVLDTTPDHCVSQLFQTVPNWFWLAARTASKLPSTFTISAGATSVSNHSSPLGVKVILPTYSYINADWIFSGLVA